MLCGDSNSKKIMWKGETWRTWNKTCIKRNGYAQANSSGILWLHWQVQKWHKANEAGISDAVARTEILCDKIVTSVGGTAIRATAWRKLPWVLGWNHLIRQISTHKHYQDWRHLSAAYSLMSAAYSLNFGIQISFKEFLYSWLHVGMM